MKRSLSDIINSIGIDRLTETPHGWKGCCNVNPDHIDSKPSMHINVDKGLVKCFSCGKFRFLSDYLLDNGATFDEVVDFLFRDYDREARKSVGMQEWVLGRKIPKSMVDRGYEIETLQYFEVGYDEYEKRITIPLRYPPRGGTLYGVQYRQYPKKFWVSDGFVKDNFIYNYEPTEHRIYTEGFTDLWRIWQNGSTEVSALLTAFPSEGQLSLMSKHKKITVALDNDIAGFKGAFKIHKELGREVEINVALFRGKDAGEQSYDAWQKSINNTITFTEFEVQLIRRNPELYNNIKKQIYGNNY
jgi:DNA primase